MKPLAVTLHKKRFPVEKKGEGTPCLLIGLGTLMEWVVACDLNRN